MDGSKHPIDYGVMLACKKSNFDSFFKKNQKKFVYLKN